MIVPSDRPVEHLTLHFDLRHCPPDAAYTLRALGVRYRLERVRDLSGLDVGSTDGRERLGLGLKAMRVLGIASPQGPASEAGAGAGRVRRGAKDR